MSRSINQDNREAQARERERQARAQEGLVSDEHEHAWSWWGSDPYLICDCGAIQDALTGRMIRAGTP